MIRKKLFLHNYILIIFFSLLVIGNNAQTVKGKVINETDEPVSNANITVEGYDYGTTSDGNGSFILNKLPQGDIELVISCVGYKSEHKNIIITESGITDLLIILKENSYDLDELVITGTRTQKKNKRYAGKNRSN